MELIDNINILLGDDLNQTLKPEVRLRIAASCFAIYAFGLLRSALEETDELQFIFTSPPTLSSLSSWAKPCTWLSAVMLPSRTVEKTI